MPFNDGRFSNPIFASNFFATTPEPDRGWASVYHQRQRNEAMATDPTTTPRSSRRARSYYHSVLLQNCQASRCSSRVSRRRHQDLAGQLPIASRENKYRFAGFREFVRHGEYQLCWDKETDFWNPAVRYGTLMVHATSADSRQGSWATVGYSPGKASSEFSAWGFEDCHQLHLQHNAGGDGEIVKIAAAHELGHVMGFVHEEPRHDGDDYVFFKCENLAGYWETKERCRGSPRMECRHG